MAPKPVRLRELAEADLDAAVAYYRSEAGERIAVDFIDAVERTVRKIGRYPHLGSSRYGHDVAIPDLRAVVIARFPYVVFYVEADAVVDVWRVLHTRRDIPTSLSEPRDERKDG